MSGASHQWRYRQPTARAILLTDDRPEQVLFGNYRCPSCDCEVIARAEGYHVTSKCDGVRVLLLPEGGMDLEAATHETRKADACCPRCHCFTQLIFTYWEQVAWLLEPGTVYPVRGEAIEDGGECSGEVA